jgi:hypothetical protein
MAGRVLILAAAGAGVLFASGCGWFSGRSTTVDDVTVAEAVTSVRVDNDAGDVKIRIGDRTTVHRTVHYDSERPGKTHKVEGDALVLGSCTVRNCWIDYEVTVPAGTRVDGNVDSGHVELDGVASVNLIMASGDVTARSVSGAINLNVASGMVNLSGTGGDVVVKSDSGDVTVDGAGKAVTVHNSSGHVRALRVDGAVDVQSESGDVTVELSSPQNVKARAESGMIEVAVPRGAYRVVAEAESGHVSAGVTNDPAGSHAIELHADSGDITLRQS